MGQRRQHALKHFPLVHTLQHVPLTLVSFARLRTVARAVARAAVAWAVAASWTNFHLSGSSSRRSRRLSGRRGKDQLRVGEHLRHFEGAVAAALPNLVARHHLGRKLRARAFHRESFPVARKRLVETHQRAPTLLRRVLSTLHGHTANEGREVADDGGVKRLFRDHEPAAEAGVAQHLQAVHELIRMVAGEYNGAFRGDVLSTHHFHGPEEDGKDRVHENSQAIIHNRRKVCKHRVHKKYECYGGDIVRGDPQFLHGPEQGVDRGRGEHQNQ
mmetsp:Transcript_65841/g.132552  ORF Transcript_65841/g.132552 Transcript_65841/m.132552 type:complete len:272 (+) Transcript_65841:930-1745(+)